MQSTVANVADKVEGVEIKPEAIKPRYNGLVGTVKTIIAEEGFSSLYKGLTPGLQR